MKLIFSFITFTFLVIQCCIAQDTAKFQHPVPKRAAIFSAVIPGAGQIYNHIYSKNRNYAVFLKVPIIYSSLYFSTSALLEKIALEKELRSEYLNRINTPNYTSTKWSAYDNYSLILEQKSAAKSRNTLYFITGGIYLIQILEASIDAHFTHFDISPELSLNIRPFYSYSSFSGLTFAFNIK
jgi:hypothetical protein